ncbi:hypothetical protein GA0071312_1490 [Saliniramus fredricksonii]|uniref:Anti-sigma factor NepR domain-containing protein n=2 Tax=Saliniramus fredricksonii TaxID=1653334 RepID=A0ABY0K7W5_9HYPH|nr:hypothetical protein GA0071312_1490 [Saliniramus fredricksonii]
MNRRLEPRALSAVADRVTSGGSPVRQQEERQLSAREARERVRDHRGQDDMADREKGGVPGAGTGADAEQHKPQLDRPTQTRIGDQLRSMYAELMDQPVPDRFRALLDQLDDPENRPKADREDGQ